MVIEIVIDPATLAASMSTLGLPMTMIEDGPIRAAVAGDGPLDEVIIELRKPDGRTIARWRTRLAQDKQKEPDTP